MIPSISRESLPSTDGLSEAIRAEVLDMGEKLRSASQEVLTSGNPKVMHEMVDQLAERVSDPDSTKAAWIIIRELDEAGKSTRDEVQADRMGMELGILTTAVGLYRLRSHYEENSR